LAFELEDHSLNDQAGSNDEAGIVPFIQRSASLDGTGIPVFLIDPLGNTAVVAA
jgi:hypothetical protein